MELKESFGDFKGRVTMRLTIRARRAYLAPALGLVLVTAISACSSSSSSSSSTPSTAPSTPASTAAATSAAASSPAASGGSSSSATTEIETNWNKFFNASTSTSERVALLQNGSDFSSALSSLASTPLASGLTSKVDSVALTSSTQATVKYNLAALGTTVASDASGTSVLQNGTWKVGDDVFCGLLTQAKSFGLSVTVPSVCSSAG
jgi:hypothetical protein